MPILNTQSMNEEYFKQRRLFKSREFKLKEDHLAIREGNWLSKKVYKVPYENIYTDTFEVTEYSKPFFWVAVILTFITLAVFVDFQSGGNASESAHLFWGTIAFLFWILTFISRESFFGVTGWNQAVVFYKDKPSPAELDAFIHKLHEKKNDFLKQNYVVNDQPISQVDELQKLAWLKEHGSITEEEFENLKKQVINESEKRGPMGFSN